MRSPIFLAATGLSLILAGCVGDISGAGDDDTSNNGTNNQGTDPTNNNNGSNGSNGSNDNNNGNTGTPNLSATVDKTSLATELATSNMITLSLKSTGGFTGSAAVAISVVDAAGAAISDWTVSLDKASVDVAANGTATVVATLKIPSDSATMAGTLKLDTTSSLAPSSSSVPVTVAKQITISLTRDADAAGNANSGNCIYPAAVAGTLKVKQGTKITWVNNSAKPTTVHLGAEEDNVTKPTPAEVAGLSHQNGATPVFDATKPDANVYTQTVSGSSGTSHWYCHNVNDPKGAGVQNLVAVP